MTAAFPSRCDKLTDEGEKLYSEWLDGEGLYLPEDGCSAMGKTYREGDEDKFVHDLFENPAMCAIPRYMEQAFGCPALEYELDFGDGRVDGFSATRDEDGTFDVLRYSNGMSVGGGYHADNLAEVTAYCKRYIKYQTERVDEPAVSLSGESRDMKSSRDGLAENKTELEDTVAKLTDGQSL